MPRLDAPSRSASWPCCWPQPPCPAGRGQLGLVGVFRGSSRPRWAACRPRSRAPATARPRATRSPRATTASSTWPRAPARPGPVRLTLQAVADAAPRRLLPVRAAGSRRAGAGLAAGQVVACAPARPTASSSPHGEPRQRLLPGAARRLAAANCRPGPSRFERRPPAPRRRVGGARSPPLAARWRRGCGAGAAHAGARATATSRRAAERGAAGPAAALRRPSSRPSSNAVGRRAWR